MKDYFNEEIQYQEVLTNKLRKYLTILDTLFKILTVILTVFSGTNMLKVIKNY